jgi:hypothetical protein
MKAAGFDHDPAAQALLIPFDLYRYTAGARCWKRLRNRETAENCTATFAQKLKQSTYFVAFAERLGQALDEPLTIPVFSATPDFSARWKAVLAHSEENWGVFSEFPRNSGLTRPSSVC